MSPCYCSSSKSNNESIHDEGCHVRIQIRTDEICSYGYVILGPRTSSPHRPCSAAAVSPEQDLIVTASILRDPSDKMPMSQVVWTSEATAVAGIKDVASLASLTPGVEFDSYSDYSAGLETNISIRGINARDATRAAIMSAIA